ncbi:MAG: nucleotide exchange factor GrpE [Muribaculaceae bacterium]|nr:nucleotide exchange factor GrpE [Muribaculaceae bacterium]
MDTDKNINAEGGALEEIMDASQAPQEQNNAPQADGGVPEESEQTAAAGDEASDNPDAVLKAVDKLQKTFEEKLLIDQHKNQLIDKLHDEVVRYQNGVVNKVVDTMAIDIIQLADNVRKTRAVYAEKEPDAENFTKLLRVVEGFYEDLQDILYRQGIEPYSVEGHDVDARRQTIIASVPADDESRHNKVAERTAEGYEREDGSVLRRERVKIFKYQPQTCDAQSAD